MKTLNELIKSYDLSCGKKDCRQCPYDEECLDHHVCECYERNADALHYLREYRKLDSLDAVAFKEDDNPPLTWDELKTMEGKPVWVEYDDHFPGRKRTKFKVWEVITCMFDDRLITDKNWDYHKSELGDIWQAYRKERE